MGEGAATGELQTAAELDAVLHSMSEGVIIGDADANVLDMNAEALRLHGFESVDEARRNLAGSPDLELRALDGAVLPYEEWPLGRVTRGERFAEYVVRVRKRATGEERLWSYSGAPVFENGRLVRTVLTVRDVTDLERTRAEAMERAQLLTSVFTSIAEGVVVYDTEGRVLQWNEEAARIFGFGDEQRGEPISQLLRTFEVTDEYGRVLLPAEFPSVRALEGETVRGWPLRLKAKDRPTIWVSATSAPIAHEGRIVGAVSTLLDITTQHELAERQQRLGHDLAAANRELTAVVRVTDVAVSTLDLDSLVRALLERLREVMSADAATVLTEENGRLRSYSSVGVEEERTGFELPVGQGFAGRIAATGQPRYIADAQATDEVVSTFLREHGIRTMLGVPLLVGEEVLGVMHVDWLEVHPQSPRELELLRVVADRAAIAIRNAQLYEERRRQEALSRALTEIDAEVNSTLEFDEIMQSVVERAARAIDADASVMYLLDDGRWRLRFAWNVPSRFVGRLYERSEALYATLATRSPSLAFMDNDLRSKEGYEGALAEKIGATGALNVIIKLGDELIASFGLFHLDESKRFTQQHLTFVRNVAASVRLALRNARLYAEERHVADTLQRALLRTPPLIEGVRFECLYQSATETAKVGGDFYDLFRLEDGRVGVVIGDVSGKGLAASTLTSLVRNTLQAYAYDVDSPAVVVDKTNRVVFDAIPPEMFMTLVFGILDPPTRRMRYCNAGHPAGLLLRSDGRIDGLEPTSPLIGAFREMEFEDAETRLGEGDLLLLYTDGVIEAKGETGMFGEERLRDTLHAVSEGGDPAQLPQRVFERLLEYTGGGVADDVAMLAIALG